VCQPLIDAVSGMSIDGVGLNKNSLNSQQLEIILDLKGRYGDAWRVFFLNGD